VPGQTELLFLLREVFNGPGLHGLGDSLPLTATLPWLPFRNPFLNRPEPTSVTLQHTTPPIPAVIRFKIRGEVTANAPYLVRGCVGNEA
jgi:hypothetical protein